LKRFLARQPIFNSERVVYGYELLYRSGAGNYYDAPSVDMASASTADNLLLFGIDRLTPSCRSFINCTRDFLVRDFATMLPKDRVVLEMLETIEIDDEVLAACRRLKQLGYLLALDDFLDRPEWQPMVALADFIKVDLLATSADDQLRLVQTYAPMKIRLLAEKVETYDDFHRTRQWGYTYFQGFFFSRPEMLSRRDIPANKLNYLLVLQAVNREQMDIEDISHRIKAEASLSFRLLRYLNSPAFPLIVEVHSIPHALSLLGERGVRKWVSMIAVACMAEGKPAELVALPLTRARFCELLGIRSGKPESASNLFLLGLLSAMDAILDMPMSDVLREISIGEDIRNALLGKSNGLRKILDLVMNYERGNWDEISREARGLGFADEVIIQRYLDSVDWAQQVLSGHNDSELKPA
jgi:c-di-GMP-related signal transduction protein